MKTVDLIDKAFDELNGTRNIEFGVSWGRKNDYWRVYIDIYGKILWGQNLKYWTFIKIGKQVGNGFDDKYKRLSIFSGWYIILFGKWLKRSGPAKG